MMIMRMTVIREDLRLKAALEPRQSTDMLLIRDQRAGTYNEETSHASNPVSWTWEFVAFFKTQQRALFYNEIGSTVSSETLILIYQITRQCILEERI
jgi:hypothetical protein